MTLGLLIAALIIIACLLISKLSNKLGLPVLIAFIALGMFFGTDGFFKIKFEDYSLMENIATIALILIIFYGGFGTKWQAAKPIAVKAVILSTAGVILTAAFVGIFCHYVLKFELMPSFLIGAVLSSTDAASVFSILRSKRLNLKDGTASLLEVESGSNDPASYMLTIIVLSLMGGDFSTGSFLYMVFAQVVYGIACGAGIAYLTGKILKKYTFSSAGFQAIFVLSIALLSYALPAYINGNGLLSAYITGIMLGNMKIGDKHPLVNFFDGITALMQMMLFFLLGLLSAPSHFSDYLMPAIAIALFLTFAARPAAILALMTPFKASLNQQALVAFAGLRGAASIVFAIMTVTHTAYNNSDIFNIVFQVVIFSILIQGSLIPLSARKLNMIDDSEDVMKTFTDYSDESPVKFIRSVISETHPWNNMAVKDLTLPPDTIIALLNRGKHKIAPRGKTILESGDVLVICAPASEDIDGIKISEQLVYEKSEIAGKHVSEIAKEDDMLIIMIQRGKNIIIPKGNTVIKAGDKLVINHSV